MSKQATYGEQVKGLREQIVGLQEESAALVHSLAGETDESKRADLIARWAQADSQARVLGAEIAELEQLALAGQVALIDDQIKGLSAELAQVTKRQRQARREMSGLLVEQRQACNARAVDGQALRIAELKGQIAVAGVKGGELKREAERLTRALDRLDRDRANLLGQDVPRGANTSAAQVLERERRRLQAAK